MMKRTNKTFTIQDFDVFKQQLILWSKQFSEVVALDSNLHKLPHKSYDVLFACDALTSIVTNDLDQCIEYQSHLRDWCFGFMSYDVKNELDDLTSLNPDLLGFPELVFFQPKRMVSIQNENEVVFSYLAMCDDEIEIDFETILSTSIDTQFLENSIELQARVSEERYKEQFSKALGYIQRGDTYELNYCIEFYKENVTLNPYVFFNQLNDISRSPFAAFVKHKSCFVMCASPERYIKKQNQYVWSQPIKGTAKRGIDFESDKQLIEDLKNNPKEKAENVMIVDLVRNDLSKIASKGSVEVTEFCEIYTFTHVHQMISTIQCQVSEDLKPFQIIAATFPMGSMTGAPKKRTMEIIEELEDHKRSLYSGAIGYISPQNDFDFNVVIRSLLYNEEKKYASLSVGSAVTFKANAETEFQECLLKAQAIRNLLSKND